MPYKLIIADDEDIIRNGIINVINWEDLGFEVVRDFDDGADVIEFIKRNSVDAILTDIRMSNISGLELAEYAHLNRPEIKVVLISGYKEFEYAKKAILYNVANYITKPINFEEINNVFREIKKELDIVRKNNNDIVEQKKLYNEMLPLIREQFFSDILLGVLKSPQEISRRAQMIKLNIDLLDFKYCIIHIRLIDLEAYLLEKWQHGRDRLKNALNNFLQGEMSGIHYFPVLNNQMDLSVLAAFDSHTDSSDMYDKMVNYIEEKKEHVKSILKLEMQYQIDNKKHNIIDVYPDSNQELLLESVSYASMEAFINSDSYKKLWMKQELFLKYINASDKEAVDNLYSAYYYEIKSLPLTHFLNLTFELFAFIITKLRDIGLDLQELSHGEIKYYDFVFLKDKEEVNKWCINMLEFIIKHTSKRKKTSSNWILQKAESYIKENYHKDVSLEDVANQVFLSSAYFCQFFKDVSGMNFSDYLVKVRMQKATELLGESRYKIQEISHMVGYSNSKYFAKIFKKNMGCTPTEYQLSRLLKGN